MAEKKPRKMGRASKLTPETQDRIIQAVRTGNYLEVAAQYAGVHKGTLYRWLEQAEDPEADEMYRNFRDALESARAQAEVRNVALIQRAADEGTWQASAWFLERTAWQRWGRRTMVSGEDGGPVKVEVSAKDSLRETLEAMLARSESDADD
jgi:transposase-like protein